METKNIKISIIVPVYKVEKYLDKCVQSLINQTLKDIEIILVDDGSPDNCPMMCDNSALQDTRVKVIHKMNGGLSSARNAGLEVISGEYYMFVDSDDWLDEKTCEEAYNEITKHSADCLMFSYTKEFDNNSIENHIFNQEYFVWNKEEIINKFHRRLFGPIGKELARPQDGDLIVAAWMQLYRSDKFKDIRFVDTKIIGTEDCWYQILVYKNCNKFIYIDKPYYHYLRTNIGSLTTKYNPHLFERWQNMFTYMEKYIDEHKVDEDYYMALQNRIAFSIIGLGLNQVHSSDAFFDSVCNINKILGTKRYQQAIQQLKTTVMPIYWKVFFYLAKTNHTTLLFAMLKIIEYLRTHKK